MRRSTPLGLSFDAEGTLLARVKATLAHFCSHTILARVTSLANRKRKSDAMPAMCRLTHRLIG